MPATCRLSLFAALLFPPACLAQTTPPPIALTPVSATCLDGERPHPACQLGDTLIVTLSNLQPWLAANSANRAENITLVLNGRPMPGLSGRVVNLSYGQLAFDLGPDPAGSAAIAATTRATWSQLLPELRASPHTLHVALEAAGAPPFLGTANVPFEVYPKYSWAAAVLLLALAIGFLLLARYSDILRDAPSPENGQKKTYSLARCQMAWWFFLIASSFLYIWLMLDLHDSITPGALILTGISAGTGLAAYTIDAGKQQRRRTLEAEKASVQQTVNAMEPHLAAAAQGTGDVNPVAAAALVADHLQRSTRLAQIDSNLAVLPNPVGLTTGFLHDILRDETGISFHRFQMAAWTLILGLVFIVSVYTQLAMPDFSPTLLSLLGISSGTYIGFKIPDPGK